MSGGSGDGPAGEGGNPFELGLLRAESDVERDAWTAAIMENAHQPSCPGNLLAALLTYQLHQDQQDGTTTCSRGRVRLPLPLPLPLTPTLNQVVMPS